MATTWTENTNAATAKAVCTTGNESAPNSATEGLSLIFAPASKPLRGVTLMAEADASQTLSGAGTLAAYIYDDQAAAWARCPDLDVGISVVTLRRQAFPGFEVPAGRPGSRVAWVPVGVTVSSGGVTLYVNGSV